MSDVPKMYTELVQSSNVNLAMADLLLTFLDQ